MNDERDDGRESRNLCQANLAGSRRTPYRASTRAEAFAGYFYSD